MAQTMNTSINQYLSIDSTDAPLPLGNYVNWRARLHISLGLLVEGPWEVVEETNTDADEGLPAVMVTPDRSQALICWYQNYAVHPVGEVNVFLGEESTTLIATFVSKEVVLKQFGEGIQFISGYTTDLAEVVRDLSDGGPVGIVYGNADDYRRPTAVVRKRKDRDVLSLVQSSGFGGFRTLLERYKTAATALGRQVPPSLHWSSKSYERQQRSIDEERIERLGEIYRDIVDGREEDE